MADVLENDISLHDTKFAFVHGHDGAVAAQVLAAAARLGVADGAEGAVGHHQPGIILERGQAGAVGDAELQALERDVGLRLRRKPAAIAGDGARGSREAGLKFAAENRADPRRAQVRGIERRVEAVSAELR